MVRRSALLPLLGQSDEEAIWPVPMQRSRETMIARSSPEYWEMQHQSPCRQAMTNCVHDIFGLQLQIATVRLQITPERGHTGVSTVD